MVGLYCTNPKGRELIATVQILPLDILKSHPEYIDTLSRIESILITDYTKDPLIIEQHEPNVHLMPSTEEDLKAITKFNSYLHSRGKAGVVRVDERIRLYILPSGESNLRCIFIDKKAHSYNQNSSSGSSKVSNTNTNTNTLGVTLQESVTVHSSKEEDNNSSNTLLLPTITSVDAQAAAIKHAEVI